jgi:superfamily II DNA or RNA helicase
MLEPGQIAQCPVEAYLEHGRSGSVVRQGLVFARSVEEARRYATMLGERGVRAECVTATTSAADREAALTLFRRGVVRVLTNVYVMTEGTDLPMAEVCCLARGAGSAGMLLQMVGRVLRPSPGKSGALLIDLRGVTWLHGYPEDERTYSLKGRGMRLATAPRCRVCQEAIDGGYPCASCGYAPTGPSDATPTVIAGVALERFGRMRSQTAEEREVTLDRWVRNAIAKGHKVTSVRYKWRAVYGEELDLGRITASARRVQ